MPTSSNEEKITYILLFARNQPSCDVSYLMADKNDRIYPMLLSTTFYFLRDLTDYRAITLQNSIYIVGGRYASTGRLSSSVFKYDAEIDVWRPCDSMKAPRVNFALTATNGKIYVLGGEGLKGVIIQTVEAYDPIADRWKEVGMLTKPRRYHAASTINGKLWSCGGASSLLEAQSTDELVTVDPRPEEWKRSFSTMTISEPRQQHCLTSINKQILLFGGCDRNGDEAHNMQNIVRVVDRSLETTPKWENLPIQLRHPHTDCGYFQLGTSLFVVGGHNSENGHPTKMIERIDVKNDATIIVDDEFEIEKNLSAVDCCVVETSKFNEHLLPLAAFLDRWVVW